MSKYLNLSKTCPVFCDHIYIYLCVCVCNCLERLFGAIFILDLGSYTRDCRRNKFASSFKVTDVFVFSISMLDSRCMLVDCHVS
jgi:hypothetical protein